MKYLYPEQANEMLDELFKDLLISGTSFVMYTWDDGEFFVEILPLERVKIDDQSPPSAP
jgi:hypothetical protein